MQWVTLDQDVYLPAGGIAEVPTRSGAGVNAELWVTRGEKWVPTIATVFGRSRYLQITNVSDTDCTLDKNTRLGIWLAPDSVPRAPGFVSARSRRYAEWQNLAYGAATEDQEEAEEIDDPVEPSTHMPQYETPKRILKRSQVSIPSGGYPL